MSSSLAVFARYCNERRICHLDRYTFRSARCGLVILALGTAVQRTALVMSGVREEGTVIGARVSGSIRATYAPVF